MRPMVPQCRYSYLGGHDNIEAMDNTWSHAGPKPRSRISHAFTVFCLALQVCSVWRAVTAFTNRHILCSLGKSSFVSAGDSRCLMLTVFSLALLLCSLAVCSLDKYSFVSAGDTNTEKEEKTCMAWNLVFW